MPERTSQEKCAFSHATRALGKVDVGSQCLIEVGTVSADPFLLRKGNWTPWQAWSVKTLKWVDGPSLLAGGNFQTKGASQ
jgi:hypothetical protein